VLGKCGIADCFETITDSGIVGREKPHPAIFEAALKSLGVKASESLYIGDIYSVDSVGATGVGMQAWLFDVAGAYKGDATTRVESLDELELVLEEVGRTKWTVDTDSDEPLDERGAAVCAACA